MRSVGSSLSDYEDEEFETIIGDAEMVKGWNVFTSMLIQWRSSGAAAYALDYNVLPMLFKIYKIEDVELALQDIMIMEAKALEMIAKQNI
ncbi:tail length tape measure protein [Shigella phage vB_SflS-ISF001]|uniref:Tape measure chaperone n=1 Tax=Shigella phage vB_SflS-ISF001 TaxID=2048005 RepID=A0A2D1GQ62_9CAUD|nr:tail length tape measure protein [Shigella phage vB_SflS-ISF001]ATN94105.1 hypothetical protein FLXISF001_027 [Shigella phage vB_SflS-ISF001]